MGAKSRPDNEFVGRKKSLGLRLPAILAVVAVCAGIGAGEATAADRTRPSKPSGLSERAATETTVSLSWRASTDNVRVKGYRIFRNGALVATVTAGRTFVMTGLRCGTTYIVMVSAYDGAGNRALPAAMFARTAACGAGEQACPTPSTIFGLLAEHQIEYGCAWPTGVYAKQAVQSVRVMLAARGSMLKTWRAKKWHRIALNELDAATGTANAWRADGVLRPNAAGLAVQYRIGRVIRILQWHNPELFEVSKSEKWALTAISWYVAAGEYNRQFAVTGATPTMNAALNDLKRADQDFLSLVAYRAWGRYRQVWQRVSGL